MTVVVFFKHGDTIIPIFLTAGDVVDLKTLPVKAMVAFDPSKFREMTRLQLKEIMDNLGVGTTKFHNKDKAIEILRQKRNDLNKKASESSTASSPPSMEDFHFTASWQDSGNDLMDCHLSGMMCLSDIKSAVCAEAGLAKSTFMTFSCSVERKVEELNFQSSFFTDFAAFPGTDCRHVQSLGWRRVSGTAGINMKWKKLGHLQGGGSTHSTEKL